MTSAIFIACLTFCYPVHSCKLTQGHSSISKRKALTGYHTLPPQLLVTVRDSKPVCKHGRRRTPPSDVSHTIHLRLPGDCFVSFRHVDTSSKSSLANLVDVVAMRSLSLIPSRDNCRCVGTLRPPLEAWTLNNAHTAIDLWKTIQTHISMIPRTRELPHTTRAVLSIQTTFVC